MVLKMIGCLLLGALLAGNADINKTDDSISIIGGADGPTSVFLAGKLDEKHNGLKLKTEEDVNGEIAFLPLGVFLKPVSYNNGQLTVLIDNQSGSDYYYGKEYTLQKKDGDKWSDVKPVQEYGWPKISLMVKDLETATEVYDLTVFGELEAGTYKLLKNEQEVEFTLIEDSKTTKDESSDTVDEIELSKAYQNILTQVAELMETTESKGNDTEEQAEEFQGIIEEIKAVGMEKARDAICYSLTDLNHDDQMELIISSKCQTDPMIEYTEPVFKAGYSVLNIYTMDGEEAVLLGRAWSRNSWFVNADGMLLCEGSSGAAYHDLFVYQLEKESVKLTEKYHLYTSLPEDNAGIILMESVDGADAEIKNQSEDASDYEIWDTFDKTKTQYMDRMLEINMIPVYSVKS